MACLCGFWALYKITNARQLAKVLSKVLSLLQKCIEQTLLLTEEKTVPISEPSLSFAMKFAAAESYQAAERTKQRTSSEMPL